MQRWWLIIHYWFPLLADLERPGSTMAFHLMDILVAFLPEYDHCTSPGPNTEQINCVFCCTSSGIYISEKYRFKCTTCNFGSCRILSFKTMRKTWFDEVVMSPIWLFLSFMLLKSKSLWCPCYRLELESVTCLHAVQWPFTHHTVFKTSSFASEVMAATLEAVML